ncbi:DUF4332 domain-containing protein [Candidatus Bathyarchaeota archaeon]|nr:DUF4332 domain-containing protein [Candidatus Bathyarchaeota archaeon]
MNLSKKGGGWTWILGAIVFLLCVNAAYAIIELVVTGPQTVINVLSLVDGTYYVSVSVYFLTSVLAATVSFGYLCSASSGRLLMESVATKMPDAIDMKLRHSRQQLEKVVTKKFAALLMSDFKVAEALKNIEMQLGETRKRIEKIDETMRNKYGKAVKRQIAGLEDVKKKIEQLESQLMPKPRLTSRSVVQEISGVGKKTAAKLESVGITSVEDLIVEDPVVIAQRTKLSKKKIEKIQATAQLLMIPRIDGNKAMLLQKAGITSADKLADENPIRLFKKVANVTENSDDTPTLEEIASYIKFARSNFSVFD